MALTDYTNILSTAIDHYARTALADNVTNNIPLLAYLSQNGKVRPIDGGVAINENLFYSSGSNGKWYTGYEALPTGNSEMLSLARYEIKQYANALTMSGEEGFKNSGPSQIYDLMAGKLDAVLAGCSNDLATAIAGDGTGSGGKEPDGLQNIVADDPTTGTVGEINSATYEWWRNQVYDFSVESVTASKDTIKEAMDTLFLRCRRNTDHPNLIVAGETYYAYYENWVSDKQRFTQDNGNKATAGFMSLPYKTNIPVIYDSTIADERLYMLNLNYLKWRPVKGRNLQRAGEVRSLGQDAFVVPIYFAGNLTCSNRALQGVMIA